MSPSSIFRAAVFTAPLVAALAVNERDELGSDLVPDYMTAIEGGDFFGWPYSYFGGIPRKPDYALGAHTACSSPTTSATLSGA